MQGIIMVIFNNYKWRRVMRLSTTLNIFSLRRRGNDPERFLEGVWACKEAGFDAIDFHFNEIDMTLMHEQQDDFVERAKAVVKESGMPISQVHARFGHVENCADPAQHEDYQRHVIRTLELAERLGAPWAVVHPLDYMALLGVSEEESIEKNAAFFRRAVEAVPNIGLAFENTGRTFFRNAERLMLLRQATGNHPRCGFCWDTGHANLIEGLDQAENIMMLGKNLRCTHIQDNRGERDDHFMPYMGITDWPPIVHALKTSGYEGDFVYESAQPLKCLPDDNVLRLEFMKYTVKLGRYLLAME